MDTAPMTISKIAEAAGVSVPTVSKVLNGRTDVAPATRAKVEALIERYEYKRRRATGATSRRMIELVFHELGNLWALEIIRGVERVAREERMAVVLSECGLEPHTRQDWLEGVLARKPDGIIMVFADLEPSQRRQLEARNIPFTANARNQHHHARVAIEKIKEQHDAPVRLRVAVDKPVRPQV